jgi:hypothetical protein
MTRLGPFWSSPPPIGRFRGAGRRGKGGLGGGCRRRTHQRVARTRWWLKRVAGWWERKKEPTNESRRLVGGGMGYGRRGMPTNESRRLVGGFGSEKGRDESRKGVWAARGGCGRRGARKSHQRVKMTRWCSRKAAGGVAGEEKPPTSRNDSLVVVADVEGDGKRHQRLGVDETRWWLCYAVWAGVEGEKDHQRVSTTRWRW